MILLCLLLSVLPCFAKNENKNSTEETQTEKLFIYHIPDDNEEPEINEEELSEPIVTDDVTADTSPKDEDIDLDLNAETTTDNDTALISKSDSGILYGYASYNEDDEISLETPQIFTIKIRTPQKIKSGKYLTSQSLANSIYSKLNSSSLEYNIAPISSINKKSKGRFSAGTTFDQYIDTAELEQSTGLFSRYETKHFAINTAYAKTINTTNNNYNDNIYFSPELKINQFITLKETLSADITTNRKKAEFSISINPFGQKDQDRLKFNIGASSTFSNTNEIIKNQFKFSTQIKL